MLKSIDLFRVIKFMLSVAVMGVIAMGFTGCGESSSSNTSTDAGAGEEAAVEAEKSDLKYDVSILGGEVVSNYLGEPALVVTYSYTNNSDKAAAFDIALDAQCFQNGLELDSTIVEGYDLVTTSELKPGATTEVKKPYALADESDVTVEVREMISFSDDIIAESVISVA